MQCLELMWGMNDNVLRAPWNRAWNTESGQPFNIVGQVDSNTCGLENLPPVKDLEIGITPLFLTVMSIPAPLIHSFDSKCIQGKSRQGKATDGQCGGKGSRAQDSHHSAHNQTFLIILSKATFESKGLGGKEKW